MTEERRESGTVIHFGSRLARSPAFQQLYRDHMDLVGETAEYLDTVGRTDAQKLSWSMAAVYAKERGDLTNLLMQITSLLLIWRNRKDGQLTQEAFEDMRSKMRLPSQPIESPIHPELPDGLKELILRARQILRRVQSVNHTSFQPGKGQD